jgi:DNA-binding NtrC family response regulator
MYDALILEDDSSILRFIKHFMPVNCKYKIVENGKEFKNFLNSNIKARLYFLDDRVEDAYGKYGFHFKKHYKELPKKDPNSIVYYIGNTPTEDVKYYCKSKYDKNIELIEKLQIPKVLEKYCS